jgi:hypothetical protein
MAILLLSAGDSSLKVEIGTERITEGAHLSLHVGGDNYNELPSIYEADKGHVIIEAMPHIISQWGDATYSTSLTARDSNFEKTEKIFAVFEGMFSRAAESGQEKNALSINWIRKQILDYYFKQTSTNARFEVIGRGRSHVIRAPSVWPFGPGAVINTKTANIEMKWNFRLQKLITPEELSLVQQFLEAALTSSQQIKFNYS